jgi:Tol biopolymer transport system component
LRLTVLAHLQLRALSVGALVVAAVALCLVVDTPPAAGTFPGDNGLIVAAGCADGAGCAAQHLWTVDARSGARVQLTSGSDRDEEPSFSRDGRRIVFAGCPVADHCRITTVAVTGANETDLTRTPPGGHDESPSFSRDGSRILFGRRAGTGSAIWLMDANGMRERALTTPLPGISDAQPTFSPEGTEIVSNRLDNARPAGEQLMVMDATGRGRRAITPPSESFSSADWQSLHPTGPAA